MRWLEVVALGESYEVEAHAPALGTIPAVRTEDSVTYLAIPRSMFWGGNGVLVAPEFAPVRMLNLAFANDDGAFMEQDGELEGAMGMGHPSNPGFQVTVEICLDEPCSPLYSQFRLFYLGGRKRARRHGPRSDHGGERWVDDGCRRCFERRRPGGPRRSHHPARGRLDEGPPRHAGRAPARLDSELPTLRVSQMALFGMLEIEVPEPGATAAGAAALLARAGLSHRSRAARRAASA